MANWRTTRTPGVYVAHSKTCPSFDDPSARCRCSPSWRGRRWDPQTKRPVWQKPATRDRSEVLAWLGAAAKGADHLAETAARGPTFESLGDQWLDGVGRGDVGRRRGRGQPHPWTTDEGLRRRRGRGKPYSWTTIEAMRRLWLHRLRPEFGSRVADELTEVEWQHWIDQLAREGLSRSTIAKHVAVASGIYAWASAPSRRLTRR